MKVLISYKQLIILSNMDQYHISDIPQRFLMTQHYQSSMDQPNLDNVQAKLSVARQRNHELAMQYFRQKYGTAVMYEEFAKNHNMGQKVTEIKPSNQQALIRHLQRKARQIQKQFYNQQTFEQQKANYSNKQEPQWVKKNNARKKNANNNPWIKVSKPEQKHQKHEHQSSKYIDSAVDPKNRQSEFISQFKHYLLNKDKIKFEQKQMQNNESGMKKTFQSKFQSSKLTNKSMAQQKGSPKKKKCYEQQLAKKIFKDIIGQSKDETKVQKLALIQYIMSNKKIMKVLGFTQSQLNNSIMKQYKTKIDNQISLQQFTFFILKSVGKEKQINQIKQEKRSKNVPEGCMLSQEVIVHFQKVFKQLDIHTDLIIKRLQYVNRLANDPLVKNIINTPAVYQSEMEKSISLRRVFERIQMQCLFGSQDQQKAKQYISWNQFLDYFKSGYSPQSLYNLVLLIDSLHKSQIMGLVEVPDVVIDIITQVAPKLVTKSGYLNVLSFIQNIKKHAQYENQKYTQVRQQSKIANLPSQTFQEVLMRIKSYGQKFMSLKQFLQYFSNRGRPIEVFQEDKINSNRKNFSGAKIKFLGDQLLQKNQDLDGYDSDPQLYQSKIINKNSPRKSGRSAKKIQRSMSIVQDSKNKPIYKKQFKVTVPKPFSFQQRQKQRLKQKQQNLKQENMQFQQFHAQPVPQKVLQKGLYYKMLQEDQKKIEQRRKSCMIMTLANQQPFQFMKRKAQKKTKQERQKFVFKAKPIPWYCSVDLLQKKKQAQILRNQKIAKQAQQNLAKAKLPPRMQRDFQQKQAKQAIAQYQTQNRPLSQQKIYREPPNFDKIHKKFEEELQRKRKQNKTTIPQQFNFASKNNERPKAQIHSKTETQMLKNNEFSGKGDSYKKIFQPRPAAASTAKYDKLVQKRRIQMQKKRKQQQQKLLQQQKRKKIDEQLKSKLQLATKNKQNNQKIEKEKRDNEMKQQMKNFQEWKKKCIEKGRQQPMLINRPLKRDQKIQKMKKLHKISLTLKENGIKGKDHDSYFNRQQLLLLQDWQQLKDKI